MKPIIGVLPLWDDKKQSIWMLPEYMELISNSGGIPIILPLESENIEAVCNICQGFLFTGGHDVDPQLYNTPAHKMCGDLCLNRDMLESKIFDYAMNHDTPILGICRGIQIINVLCGGTLYQDLPSEFRGIVEINHHMTPPYDRACHKVDVVDATPLHTLLNCKEIEVNSYHHQAIKDLSPQLSAMALSKDGLVEAIYMPDRRFVMAVQWHPEFNFRKESSSLIITKAFISACK